MLLLTLMMLMLMMMLVLFMLFMLLFMLLPLLWLSLVVSSDYYNSLVCYRVMCETMN
jgi:hypothetical protein